MISRLHQLSALGQSIWIDYLSRELIESGALARTVDEDAVVGVTSNPTIFAKARSRPSPVLRASAAKIASGVVVTVPSPVTLKASAGGKHWG